MRCIATLPIILLFLSVVWWWIPQSVSPREQSYELNAALFGHNGLGVLFPEDSLANLCFLEHCHTSWCKDDRNSLQGIEFDVQLSSDHKLVLRHDDHVRDLLPFQNQSSFPYETLNEYSAKEISSFDMQSRYCRSLTELSKNEIYSSLVPTLQRVFCEKNSPCASDLFIPTLDQAIDRVKKLSHPLQISIEIKPNIANSTAAVRELASLFQKNPFLYQNSFVLSFVPQVLHALKAEDPNITTGWIIRRTLLDSLCKSRLLDEKMPWAHYLLCDIPFVASSGDFLISLSHSFIAPRIGIDIICPHFEYLSNLSVEEQGAELSRWKTFLQGDSNQVYMWGVNFDHFSESKREEMTSLFHNYSISYTTHTFL